MWNHPSTQRNLKQLKTDGVHFIEPDAGEMACGTIGPGRLSEPERIVAAALEILERSLQSDLRGERILITVGATREEIDPVRFISNRSSGKMGFALAAAAQQRGANVIAIAGSTTAPPPSGINIVRVTTADEMARAVANELERATVFIGAAAVADYRPSKRADQKIKKHNESLTLELERTPDILSQVTATLKPGTLVVGFAAESENLLQNAQLKLQTKNLDAIVANDITQSGAGFDSDTNAIKILTRSNSNVIELPLMSKADTANHILDMIVRLRSDKTESRTVSNS